MMKTKAVRLYGQNDLRLEEFELNDITENDILARVVSDSICMSSYKAAIQGKAHKRVPEDIDVNPVIIGHEFCGEIIKVGARWVGKFKEGSRFAVQPAVNLTDDPFKTPGYSYPYIGGGATYIIIPAEIIEHDCLLEYNGEAFFYGSLAEPMSCIIGAYHLNYHTFAGSYSHDMGIVKDGNMALLAGAGPMGLGAIDYALHCDRKPRLIVVTDINDLRLKRASMIYSPDDAKKLNVELIYINTSKIDEPVSFLRGLTGGRGYDDVFVYAPIKPVVEQGDGILARDGCLNFFAGPTDTRFSALLNFYNVHYSSTHIVGTSGGNTNDMIESLRMMEKGSIDPSPMITHIGGLDCYAWATLNLPEIPGGKKLIYTNIKMELTALDQLAVKGANSPLYAGLAKIVGRNNGLWCAEAERFLLSNAHPI